MSWGKGTCTHPLYKPDGTTNCPCKFYWWPFAGGHIPRRDRTDYEHCMAVHCLPLSGRNVIDTLAQIAVQSAVFEVFIGLMHNFVYLPVAFFQTLSVSPSENMPLGLTHVTKWTVRQSLVSNLLECPGYRQKKPVGLLLLYD